MSLTRSGGIRSWAAKTNFERRAYLFIYAYITSVYGAPLGRCVRGGHGLRVYRPWLYKRVWLSTNFICTCLRISFQEEFECLSHHLTRACIKSILRRLLVRLQVCYGDFRWFWKIRAEFIAARGDQVIQAEKLFWPPKVFPVALPAE